MQRVKSMNDVLTGTFLVLVALLALYVSWPLNSGSTVGLGPGYLPKFYALIQLVLGMVMIVTGFLQVGDASEPWRLRPLVLILASVAFFALTIERMGLVVALTGLVLIACAAHSGTKLREALALAFGSVVVSALVFVKALGLSIALWPSIPWGN